MREGLSVLLAAVMLLCCLPGCDEQPAEGVLIDGAVYKIMSVAGGRAMGARDFGMAEGAFTELQIFEGDLNQAWRAHLQADGTYRLECLSTGRYLTLKRNQKTEGVQTCVTAEKADSALQNWKVERSGEGYTLSSAFSGLYLQAKDGSRATGTQVVQMEKESGDVQRWKFDLLDDGSREFPQMLQLSGSVEHSSTPEIQHFGDTYYLYAMQDGISVKTSPDMKNWTKQDNIVSTKRGYPYSWMDDVIPNNWIAGIWAPGVYKIGELYCLYYCFSVTGKQTSAIGLLTNTTLDPDDPNYKWVERGPVLTSATGDDFNAIDPNIIIDEEGQPWMAYGSYWSGIKLRRIDPQTGMVQDDEVFSIASRTMLDHAIEAPYIVRYNGYYYLFCAVDQMTENYHVECGRSKNITGPYLDRYGVDMMQGGGTPVTEGKVGVDIPGHASEFLDSDGNWYLVTEYFQGDSNSLLGISTMLWDKDGWPETALSPNLFAKK